MKRVALAALCLALLSGLASAQVCNLKVVTDASPDTSDMQSLVHSVTSRWPATKDKCWAMWYWVHLMRRQTSPMMLHGLELADPVRQFNDYGYAMCSTVAGVNCAIWNQMGLKIKFWDISAHTVSEVFYDDTWHMYDDSMSAIYTLCDGHTIASVMDIGKEQGCPASGGKVEPSHIAKYHCLTATSPRGFLTGSDYMRSLEEEGHCFLGHQYRWYYHNWDFGHRYILNVRDGESYTRYYQKKGDDPKYWTPNGGKDPESSHPNYRIRGSGAWTFAPSLAPGTYKRFVTSETNVAAVAPEGLRPVAAGKPAEVVFKVEGANVITGQTIRAAFTRRGDADAASIAVSTTNGVNWKEVWKADKAGDVNAAVDLVGEVNGFYEVLVKVTLQAAADPAAVTLASLDVETMTQINSKAQPNLLLGRNTVYVGAGDPTDSIVFWPDLRADYYKPFVVEERNITTAKQHPGYLGTLFPDKNKEDGWIVFRMDAPRDITKITYGGRLYNRAGGSHIDFLHSFDGGKTWTKDYTLTSVEPPWDVIEYVTVDKVPPGTRSVLFKYLLNRNGGEGKTWCSLYAVRMETNHQPVDPGFKPLDVTFTWDEVQKDRTRVTRSHTQRVPSVPFKYVVNVGGEDRPIVSSLRVATMKPAAMPKYGYSDGKDVGGAKWTYRWVTYGKNCLEGKPYTLTAEPTGAWGGDDPKHTKLTDGVVGPNYAGGIAPMSGACFDEKGALDITVDIGESKKLGAFRIHTCGGWPWWGAFSGDIKDEVEVLTSLDGKDYTSAGAFNMVEMRYKDIPINHMFPDDETAGGWNFEMIPDKPVDARYVKFHVTPRRTVCITEVQALDFIKHEPYDIRIALPDEK